jgi:hypothetical protein
LDVAEVHPKDVSNPGGEDVSNLWICYPLGVRENHQRA